MQERAVRARASATYGVRLHALPGGGSEHETQLKITPRELEVLELIAEGLSTREISSRLWVTDETVKTHVRRLLERLDAKTRAQAVAVAFREGILRP